MTAPFPPFHSAFQCKVEQFSAVFRIARAPLLRPGLDPKSRFTKSPHANLGRANPRALAKAGVQPQVRDDDRLSLLEKTSIARKVTQFSGLFA